MKNELVGLSVAVVCAVVLIGTILVPFVDAFSTESYSYVNEGMPYAAVDEDTHTIVVTSSDITVDGETIDQTLFPSGFTEYTIVYSDSGFIRLISSTVTLTLISGQSINVSYDYSEYTVTITIAGDVATVTTTDSTASSLSLSDVLYYISTEGDYVLALNPYVSSDDVIIGAGQTWFSTSLGIPTGFNIMTFWEGTVEDVDAVVINSTHTAYWSDVTVSDVTVNTTEIAYDLYRVDSVVIEYTATYTSTSVDYNVTSTYTYFLAPAEVTYENPDYIGDMESTLVAVIPLFTILAVLCAVVYAVMRNRD